MFGNMNDPAFVAFVKWYEERRMGTPNPLIGLDYIKWDAFNAGWSSRIVPDPLQYRVVDAEYVAAMLTEGWRLYGNPFRSFGISKSGMSQAMVK